MINIFKSWTGSIVTVSQIRAHINAYDVPYSHENAIMLLFAVTIH